MEETTKLDNLNSFIQDEAKKLSEIFLNIAQNGFVKQFHFSIDETKLNSDYSDKINITQHGDFVSMFQALQEFKEFPALYFFQINPTIPKSEIVTRMKDEREKYQLNIPADNSTKDNSGILYVGKVTECFFGRLIEHLGYHRDKTSHGLQIDYWIPQIPNPQLSFTVFFFEKEVRNHIEVLERIVAKSLNPIIGKH